MNQNKPQRLKRLLFFTALMLFGVTSAHSFLSLTNLKTLISDADHSEVKVPEGFRVQVFADGLREPRFIRFGSNGALYVAERDANRILILVDDDMDGVADQKRVFANEVPRPHSLTFHKGALYVGVPNGVQRFWDRDGDGVSDQRQVLIDDYPTGGHSTRTVEFLPDGRMVVSVGSSCNVCIEDDPRRATVLIYDEPPAGDERVFARGLRNAVGLAVHPETGALWATNNGRDMMGDDLPPEALYILKDGNNYGWPSCHNGTIIDPDLGDSESCTGVAKPVLNMQAHSAPLGLVFYTGKSFPEEYHGDLFIAFHGSWNRTIPTGYKVVRLPMQGSKPSGPLEDFASGWLDRKQNRSSGRPVGLAIGPDGAMYVSDDKAGMIYRISYAGR